MRQTLQDKIANAKNLLDVLLVMKESIMIDTHVSTLAYFDHNVEPFNGTYGIASVRPFPLEEDQQSYEVQVYYFESSGDDFEADTIVTVIFADRNFINNLNAVEPVGKPTDDTTLHTYKFGIITSTGVVAVKNLEKKIKELQEEIDDVAGDVNELDQAVRAKCEKIKFEGSSTEYTSNNGVITLPNYPADSATKTWVGDNFLKKTNLTPIDLGAFSNNVITITDSTLLSILWAGGFFMFMYSNCVCYTPINSTMIQATTTAPIRIPMAIIYDSQGQAKLGILRIEGISVSGNLAIQIRLNDVRDGFHLYLFAL